MHVVLVEPEIPPNTGNVARTCVMTNTKLHLVEPLGFSLAEKEVKRSGLDYWPYLNLEIHPDFFSLKRKYSSNRFIYFSTRGTTCYDKIEYRPDDLLVFGCETKGLPADVVEQAELLVRVPMVEQIPRSLNLGNTVALVLYEALRQQGFPGMH